MTVIGIDNVGVAVRDAQTVGALFAERLGFEVTYALDADPPSATVQVGDRYLYVFQTRSTSGSGERTADLIGNPPGLDHISFTVDDVDSAYRELSERGLTFAGEPETVEEWGLRMVGFNDPEGNSYFLVRSL